jgi:hypothetical protein
MKHCLLVASAMLALVTPFKRLSLPFCQAPLIETH